MSAFSGHLRLAARDGSAAVVIDLQTVGVPVRSGAQRDIRWRVLEWRGEPIDLWLWAVRAKNVVTSWTTTSMVFDGESLVTSAPPLKADRSAEPEYADQVTPPIRVRVVK